MKSVFHELEFPLPHIRLAGWEHGCMARDGIKQDSTQTAAEGQNKPLVLALHGWLDNAQSFAPLAASLNDVRLMAIDWPGHGMSEHRAGHYPLHWIDYLFDLHAVLQFLKARGDSPKAIIGHSLGGIVASAYVAAHPDACEKLVLIEALGPLSERPGKCQQRLADSFASHWSLNAKNAGGDKPKAYSSLEAVIEARHRLTGLNKAACELILARNFEYRSDGEMPGWYNKTDPRLKLDSPLRLTPAHAEAFIRDLEMPTLLLMGEQGFAKLHEALEHARPLYRQLQVQTIKGDHHLHMTDPDGAADAIRHFLSTCG
ncbi:alpha/beta fold hydrolase [Shewanella litorisediminis]|uniref:Alpha/beta hydrolase n=1 Tax=Shewanella litorisediminis TaxID=1173586 RepID=A0ABX7FYW1_9GAMM|nr:alpha/beta hydrolase [Shewanella litorisediminis]MCL2918807.1 alpha/beta hydrolase [Shewanella litorisediminis]QRH00224.1 alpha/beta hydrolase [Shewanella litorisediminis]